MGQLLIIMDECLVEKYVDTELFDQEIWFNASNIQKKHGDLLIYYEDISYDNSRVLMQFFQDKDKDFYKIIRCDENTVLQLEVIGKFTSNKFSIVIKHILEFEGK